VSHNDAHRSVADSNRRIAVLISGRGSNLQALIDACRDGRLHAEISVVISNRADAAGLTRAHDAGIEALTIQHRNYSSRAEFEGVLVRALRERRITLVCLAGFMRLLGATFLEAFPNAVLNVHPSLLPAFPGIEAQRQAGEYGAKLAGATVHFGTGELDAGPIIRQATVPVLDSDTPDTLAARILEQEHRIYPEAVAEVLGGGWTIQGRRYKKLP